MRKNKKKKPVFPWYAMGLVWIAYSLLFGFPGFGALIKCAVLAYVIFLLVKKLSRKGDEEEKQDEQEEQKQPKKASAEKTPPKAPESPKEEKKPEPERSTGNPELDAVIRQGRQSVQRIRELNDDIPDFKISAQLKQIEILTASIIDQVEKKEDKLKQVRQFMNYYLPTTIRLLEQYVQMQNVGMKGENIESGMRQIEELLDKVIVAFQKQLDSLFERDVVDITADIQVMERMMASQGLTNENDF